MSLCLVTGGAGFVGRWVVASLLKRGKRVLVLDNLSCGSRSNLEEFAGHPRFEGLIRGDVRQLGTLYEIFFRGLEICFHIAGNTDAQRSIDDPETTFDSDVMGTMRLLEKCREYDTKILFVSTCQLYDDCEGAINEENTVRPRSPYAACKLAAENLCLGYHYSYRLPVVVVRPFNTYGPFQKLGGDGGVVARFQQQVLEEKPIVLYGDGSQTRDFTYVEDCAEFLVDAGFSRSCEGQILNVATGIEVRIRALAEMIAGDSVVIKEEAHPCPDNDIVRMCGDSTKARELIGWNPRVKFSEGLGQTKHWMLQQNIINAMRTV